MEGSVVFGEKKRIHSLCKLKCTCGASDLIVYNADFVAVFGETKHCFNEVFAVTVEPCCTDDKVSCGELFYEVFTCEFAGSVNTLGIGNIKFLVGLCSITCKYIIRAYMQDFGAVLFGSDT